MRRRTKRQTFNGFLFALSVLVAFQASCITPFRTKPSAVRPEPAASVSTQPVVLEIEIVGIRSDQGTVRVAVFNQAEGFPADYSKAYQTRVVPAKKGVVRLLFEQVLQGDFAVAAIHDGDDNHLLTTGFLGIRQEGYAVSNDASSRFGPPRFSAARVAVSDRHKRFVLTMRYP